MARGLCMMHYKRERSGRPLVDEGPARGDPDGHGLYGVLDDDGETVACHECGARVAGLGVHVVTAHGMSAREYKIAHGLPLTGALSSRASRERMSAGSRERMSGPGWAAFEASRDPAAAAAARGPEAFAMAVRHRDAEVAPANGRAGRTGEVRACPVCAATWCPLPGGYRVVTCSAQCWRTVQAWCVSSHLRRNAARDARVYADVAMLGRSTAEVAAEHGISVTRVQQIVRALWRASLPPEMVAREEILRTMAAQGATLREIGDALGVSRERARQLLVKRRIVRSPRPRPPRPARGDAQRARLEALWRARFEAVLSYREVHGHLPVHMARDADGVSVGSWLSFQRRLAVVGALAPERRRALEEAGIELRPSTGRVTTGCPICRPA